jgi:hypothetical protein
MFFLGMGRISKLYGTAPRAVRRNRSEPILAERLALFTSSESALRSIQLRRRKIKIAKTPV